MRTGWGSRFSRGNGLYASQKNKKRPEEGQLKITAEQMQGFMDIKRERNRWDADHKPLFRNIGLVISLLVVIVAFSWKSAADNELLELAQVQDEMQEIMDIPVSKQPPPPPPKMHKVFEIKEVDDEEIIEEIEVSLDIEVNEETKIEEVVYQPVEFEEEKAEAIFTIVEDEPMPVGGMEAFYAYVKENLDYPRSAIRLQVTGIVFVKFVVEKDGSITDVHVVKGIGAGCDEEAVRVLAEAPKWTPGKQRGVPVRVQKIMPIRFTLRDV